VILLLLFSNHRPEKQIVKDYENQRKYDSSQAVIEKKDEKIKDDSIAIVNLSNAVDGLIDDYKIARDKIAEYKKNANKKDSSILTYDCKEISKEFYLRYPKDTAKTDSNVNIPKPMGQHALIELNYLDTLTKKIVPTYIYADSVRTLQITKMDSIRKLQDSTIDNYKTEVTNYKSNDGILKDENKGLKKQNTKQQFKTIVSQLTAIIFIVAWIVK